MISKLYSAISVSYHVSPSGEKALAEARRRGFKLAILGRTLTTGLLAFVFLFGYHYPVNIGIFFLTLTISLFGWTWLFTERTRFENTLRFTFFAIDAAIVSVILALAPLSSGDDIPQNLVFMTTRSEYYFIVIAASVLTLSPLLVMFTGVCCALGLTLSTLWIMAGMSRIQTFSDLPLAPSREDFFATVLNPDFLGVESRIEEVSILAAVTVITAVAVYGVRSVVLARVSADEKRSHLQHLFGKYIPPSVIPSLKEDGQISPESRNATLLFADVEGFTSLSETLKPNEVIDLLNELFAVFSAAITAHGGLVVNYFGDAVIASFNAPSPLESHALHAVLAAKDITVKLGSTTFLGHRLKMRIGVSTGPVAIGTVGSQERLSFTLYGDAVNVSQRLEALNKEFGTTCLLSAATFERVRNEVGDLRALGKHVVRNKQAPVEVYVLE